jgi:hypothetical protein
VVVDTANAVNATLAVESDHAGIPTTISLCTHAYPPALCTRRTNSHSRSRTLSHVPITHAPALALHHVRIGHVSTSHQKSSTARAPSRTHWFRARVSGHLERA